MRAFHILQPNSVGSHRLREFIARGAMATDEVFTIDRDDFATYRMRRGHRHYPLKVVG